MVKKKIKVFVIKFATYVLIIIVLTTGFNGASNNKAYANEGKVTTITYNIENNIKGISAYATNNNGVVQFEKERDKRLLELCNLYGYNFKDIGYLKMLIEVEESFALQKGELIALASVENSFGNKTVTEKDGITSFGTFQMRLITAKPIRESMINRGLDVPTVTENRLRNDRQYQALLAASYLQELHVKTSNNYQVWCEYNAGSVNMKKFKSTGYKYTYSMKMRDRVDTIQKIMGDFY